MLLMEHYRYGYRVIHGQFTILSLVVMSAVLAGIVPKKRM